MRCVFYLRMSTDRQEASIEDQRAAVVQHAAEKGYRVVGEYCDEAISGDATPKRSAFLRMMADAVKKRFDLILCWDQDRFGRFDPIEAGYYVKPIRDVGIQLETILQGRIDWNDFSGRLMWTIQTEAKHGYLRDLGKNVVRGLKSAVAKGIHPGPAPYGYRKQGKQLVIGHEDEVATVREIFRLKAMGMGYRTIAVRMLREGRPARGNGWSTNQVRYIINRRLYVGEYRYGMKEVRGKYSNVGDMIVVPNAVEPIITEQEWQAAQQSKRNNTVHTRGGCFVGALAGLMTCGMCGSPMTRFKYKTDRGYVCSKYHQAKGCGFGRIMDTQILPAVAEQIQARWGRSVKEIAKAVEKLAATRARSIDRKKLAEKLRDVDAKIERAAGRVLTVPDELLPSVNRKLAELADTRRAIQSQLDMADESPELDAMAVAQQIHELPAILLGSRDTAEIRRAVTAAVASITVQFRQLDRGKVRRFFAVDGIEIILR